MIGMRDPGMMIAAGVPGAMGIVRPARTRHARLGRWIPLGGDYPDAPDIARVLRTGYPDASPPLEPADDPRCPLCDQPAEVIVTDLDGVLVGCDGCLAFWEAGWYAVGERERFRGRV